MSDDFGANIILRLISKMPAQQILVYLALARGLNPGQVLQSFADMPLEDILLHLNKEFAAEPCLGPAALPYTVWFKTIHEQMESTGERGTRRAGQRRRFVPFFPRPNGRIQLQEFLEKSANPAETVEKWAQEVETVLLIANLLAGIPDAMEQLIAHERWIQGYIAARVSNSSESHRVLNHAWNRIYKKLHTFDPTTTSFRSFALIWVPYAIGSSVESSSRLPVVTGSTGGNRLDADSHRSREILADYLEQNLSEEEQSEIEDHLASCEICVNKARLLRSPNDVWQKTGTG